jgi:hypothetical protein
MSDELNRDKMYRSGSADDDEDDGLEYELEPPDADVLAAEQRRAEETVAATQESIDIDEIYREFEGRRDTEILKRWASNFRFRFQVRDMLIATAVVAILLTLAWHGLLLSFAIWGVMLGVLGVTLYLQWQERQRQAEADRKRQQMYAERRAKMQQRPAADRPTSLTPAPPPAAEPPIDEFDRLRSRKPSKTFQFHFSLQQLLYAFTAAAVLLGLIRVLGGADNAATLLGMIALIGLVVHAFGYEPPGIVAFGWWILILFYIAVSLFAAVWRAIGA